MAEVTVERRVAASPDVVYPYLTDSDLLARWMGEDALIEPEPEGSYMMRSPQGPVAHGRVLELHPGQSVTFTWGWEGLDAVPPGSSTVVIELIPDGDGTLVRLTHSGLPDSEIGLHELGWNHYLDRLLTTAEGGDPGPDPGAGS